MCVKGRKRTNFLGDCSNPEVVTLRFRQPRSELRESWPPNRPQPTRCNRNSLAYANRHHPGLCEAIEKADHFPRPPLDLLEHRCVDKPGGASHLPYQRSQHLDARGNVIGGRPRHYRRTTTLAPCQGSATRPSPSWTRPPHPDRPFCKDLARQSSYPLPLTQLHTEPCLENTRSRMTLLTYLVTQATLRTVNQEQSNL